MIIIKRVPSKSLFYHLMFTFFSPSFPVVVNTLHKLNINPPTTYLFTVTLSWKQLGKFPQRRVDAISAPLFNHFVRTFRLQRDKFHIPKIPFSLPISLHTTYSFQVLANKVKLERKKGSQ